jgi:hypothetical protein
VDFCMAGVVRTRPNGVDVLEPCGFPKKGIWGNPKGLAMPLCAAHLAYANDRKGLPRWFGREVLHELRVGLGLWVAARRGHAAELARPLCPACGCGRGKVCRILWDGGDGTCAPAGSVPGARVCSGCVTAATRLPGSSIVVTQPHEAARRA